MKFSEIEQKILKFWEKKSVFQKTLAKTKSCPPFVFYEGPPFANGRPGVHHILARAYKDIVARYKTMRGYFVERKAGWDTHGLPAEIEAEKILKIKGKKDIERIGIKKFIEACKQSVFLYIKEWEEMTERMGYWVDLKNAYLTCSKEYIETLWWLIEQIWQKGLLYQDYKVVPHCPRCGTTLSSHEVAQGYKNVEEPSVYLKFKVLEQKFDKPAYFLVWTTTPWTLPGNVALAVHKSVKYVRSLKDDEYWILAKERLGAMPRPYEVIEEFLGEEMLGWKYQPLFEFVQPNKPAWFVIHGDFVSVEDGTGIVHIAPAFGEEDMKVGKENNLPVLMTVEPDGKISAEILPWAGMWVKDADPLIMEDLKKRNILLGVEKIRHDYPFCWRCDTPLLYYAKPCWFIKMSDSRIKQSLIKNNQEINWIPEHIKEGRFGEWLAEIKDWAISRERYWGTPLPIWECQACNYRECVGSFEELSRRAGKKIPRNFDPHRPFIDEWTWQCPRCGKTMKRVPEVLDCWLDSGAMPFAQWHYPFENKSRIDANETQINADISVNQRLPRLNRQVKVDSNQRESAIRAKRGLSYPADFISEAIDQTRGWFYSLLAISTLLNRGTCYKNVICLGHVLDAQGQKMSKSKGNVIGWEIIKTYGADPVRWHFYTSNQPGEGKPFNPEDVRKAVQRFFLILWNCLEFYKLHTNFPRRSALSPRRSANVLDRWILAKMNLLIKEVTKRIDEYDITGAGREIENFVNDLSQWYIRRSRDRFKISEEPTKVLGCVLSNIVKLLAPFTPFISDEIYQQLIEKTESVHLSDWPVADEKMIDTKIIEQMGLVRKICEIGHKLRAMAKIKVRQPLASLKIKNSSPRLVRLGQKISNIKNKELLDLIAEEVNVKEIVFDPEIREKIELETKITPELKEEGLLRELIRQINSLRKEAKLTIKDKINLYYQTESSELKSVFHKFVAEIKKKTISQDLIEDEGERGKIKKEIEIEGQKITLLLAG